jgi:hypothetical protein
VAWHSGPRISLRNRRSGFESRQGVRFSREKKQCCCVKLTVFLCHTKYYLNNDCTVSGTSQRNVCGNVLAGLPDFSWYNIRICGKLYQITIKYTKWPQNISNGRKIYPTAIKYTNTFHRKSLQKLRKLGFLVWKYAIWQPWWTIAGVPTQLRNQPT